MWWARSVRSRANKGCIPTKRAYTFAHGPYDPYNALTNVFEKPASSTQAARESESGPLAGWPVSIKENISMKGVRTTCASRMLADYEAPYDATVVQRLRHAGAYIASRNNCDEFAMGALNKHSFHGPVANPVPYQDKQHPDFLRVSPRAPGGSSGGAAAAVSAGLCRVYVYNGDQKRI